MENTPKKPIQSIIFLKGYYRKYIIYNILNVSMKSTITTYCTISTHISLNVLYKCSYGMCVGI